MKIQKNTSWQKVNKWYNKIVGDDGHYYHKQVIIPGVLKLLDLNQKSSLADLGCGQGILSRSIPKISRYLGLDISSSLINEAKNKNVIKDYTFEVKDVTKDLDLSPNYTHVVMILSLQNMENAEKVIKNASNLLQNGGILVLVLNHPHFRIPRHTGWKIDENTKQQYRWINKYLSFSKIPIEMHPGSMDSFRTWSFHHSLHDYSEMLSKAGLYICKIEEWVSDKESVGKYAKMENRARSEFPLFMAIKAQKL